MNAYRSFDEARLFVHVLELSSSAKYRRWAKSEFRPQDIPLHPDKTYAKQGWICWGDFLGTDRIANQNRKFCEFEEARKFARSLKLQGQSDWSKWAKSQERPFNIPAAPSRTYAKKGWTGWGDFLGTGKIATKKRKFKTFEEARRFIHSLKFNGVKDWEMWAKTNLRPHDIPSAPNKAYDSNGWTNWGDFLGTGRTANQKRKFLSFNKARSRAHSLNFQGKNDWNEWSKTAARPNNIPTAPDVVYANDGWNGWGDFLGTNVIGPKAYQFKFFIEARAYVQKLNLKNTIEWRSWAKSSNRPKDIPSGPSRTYARKGWKNWGDFLGTDRIANQHLKFKPFFEARNFIRSLNLTNSKEYFIWAKKNAKVNGIPQTPHQVYAKSGWKDWTDFLGANSKNSKRRNFLSFEDTKNFIQTLGLHKRGDWTSWAKTNKRPSDIPSSPNQVYANEWKGWGDFLGTDRTPTRNRNYRPFKKARNYAWTLNLQGREEWIQYDLPSDIPKYPNEFYANSGWKNWNNFLGKIKRNSRDSNGSRKIEIFLKNHNIDFTSEKKFESLTGLNGGSLRFDFFLPKYNLLIEFHGKQHFEPIRSMGGKETFELLTIHDKKKEAFAKSNGYGFLMIRYQDEKNIEHLLKLKLQIEK